MRRLVGICVDRPFLCHEMCMSFDSGGRLRLLDVCMLLTADHKNVANAQAYRSTE